MRVIEFKKRRVNHVNKSIPKKKPSFQEKRKGFLESKGKAYAFQIKQTLFILALQALYTKFLDQLTFLFLTFFSRLQVFLVNDFVKKKNFYFFLQSAW